mgnify:CR=1 FL=1
MPSSKLRNIPNRLESKITDKEEYFKVMEALGKEPNPDKMPLRDEDFPYEVQMAFYIHSMLPDVWDGAGGNYFGKNWSALGTILDVYKVVINTPAIRE